MGNKVKCEYNWHNTGHQVFYNPTTFETISGSWPHKYIQEFDGGGTYATDGTTHWTVVDVAGATEAIVADTGLFAIALTNANEAQDAVLYHNDNRTFNVMAGLVFETRVNVSVLPTGVATLVFGMSTDHNLDKDTVAEAAWFRLDGSGAIDVESDDNTNNNDDVTTGVTAVAGTFFIARIDFTTIADVKFFINGARVASGTTFNMSNLSATTRYMQPYFSLDKGAAADVGTLQIDYVKIFSDRP